MRKPWIIVSLLPAALAAGWTPPAAAQDDAPAVPVVVAVDTSRSLLPTELAGVVGRLRAAVAALDADTPAALLAFDDEPRWLRPPGASTAEVRAMLGELTPRGDFTLLNDALFVAARELPAGGVILLATDGRDENSATTVEDIGRRCEAQGVRIVSVGAGRGVEERSLRRLALLSNGAYLGEVEDLEPAQVAGAVQEARAEVISALETARAERQAQRRALAAASPGTAAAARPGERPAAAPPGSAPDAAGDDATGAATPWLYVIGLAVLAAAAVAALWLWLRGRRDRPSYCSECGTELAPGQSHCAQCQALELRAELAEREVATLEEAPEVTVDTAVFHQMTLSERLEKTQVLQNQSVLLVKKPGEAPRSFLLGHSQAFGVGREREGNTLRVPDPALSAHHFKIVPEGERFYFVDLQSTNGSYINGDRTPIKELRSGDVIRAGQVEFEFKSHGDFS